MLVLTALILCFSLLPSLHSKIKIDKTFLIGVLIVAVWAVSSYILNKDTNPYFLSGNPEKTHGLYFSLALFMLFWVLFSLSKGEKKNLLFVSFIAFFGVTVYAFFQKLGLDPLRQLYNTRLDLWRIFSTLGNPNYLAGYVLMILPLLRVYRFKNELSWQEHLWEVFIWVLSGVLIYWTGSYLAWVLFAGYV